MKQILFFLMLSVNLFAQEATVDTTYFAHQNGKFFKVHALEYENGNQKTEWTVIADDTLELFGYMHSQMAQKIQGMASDGAYVSTFTKRLTDINRENTTLKSLANISPLDSIQKLWIATFTVSGWTLKEPSGPRDIVFTQTAQGQMRHKVGTDAAKNVLFFGPVMRLQNYPTTGQSVDLYRLASGNYSDLTRTYILRRPGSTGNSIQNSIQAKEAEAPTLEVKQSQEEAPAETPKKKSKKGKPKNN